jgi:glycosyltransferase involved in cell wall biosynthesis
MLKVLIVGDSRKMKGGVSSVIKSMENSYLWEKYHCYWVECQINSTNLMKLIYLIKGIIVGFFQTPFYDIINFQTTPAGLRRLYPLFFWSVLLRKKIIIHLHVGNQLKYFQNDKLFIWCCYHASLVLTLGKSWMKYLPVNDGNKVDYLYNPSIPTETPSGSEKYFLFAAFLDIVYKGYDTLIEGFAKFSKDYPDWKLVVCGTGEIDNIKRIIKKCNVEDKVELPGWVEGEIKANYFQNAYAYVMTSLMEGLPMSILESMSYGKPIISTPVGCLPEFLEDKKSVLFFNFHDSEGLARRMRELIENKELYDQLIENGHRIINEQFTKDIFLEKLDRIYTNLK